MRIATRWLATAIIAFSMLVTPVRAPAQVSVGVSVGLFVNIPPPPIPVYYQPPAPGPGFVWIPGYWAWGPAGYYWVPGYWEMAPYVGLYWTPGYWAFDPDCDCYGWDDGYWGPQVGFYGGINYGAGYFGVGYVGGYWNGPTFVYNTAVTNVNVTYVHNTYFNSAVIASHTIVSNRVAFNGGPGGDPARPTRAQLAVARMHRDPPTAAQLQHAQWAGRDRNFLYSVNHGHPGQAAVMHPFSASRRPAHFAAITPHDRVTARAHVIPVRNGRPVASHRAAPMMRHIAPAHHIMTHHVAPVRHAARMVHHAAPAHHPQYRAPAYHPQYRAPAYHPAARQYVPSHAAPRPQPRRTLQPR